MQNFEKYQTHPKNGQSCEISPNLVTLILGRRDDLKQFIASERSPCLVDMERDLFSRVVSSNPSARY